MRFYGHSLLFASGLSHLLDCVSSKNCDRPQSVESAWYSSHVDDYLLNYLNSHVLNFKDGYLQEMGIDGFSCDPGKKMELTANQSCNPFINDSDWLILKSVEHWIDYANSLSIKIDEIGAGLLDDLVVQFSSSISPRRDASIRQGHLHIRRMLKEVEVIPTVAKHTENLADVNVELQPQQIAKTLKVPLANQLVPESKTLSASSQKLPSFWVRVSRYSWEIMRRGYRRVKSLFSNPPEIPYHPSELGSMIVNPEAVTTMKSFHEDKTKIINGWRSFYSEQPSSTSRKKELKQLLANHKKQYEEVDQEEVKLVNHNLRLQSENDVKEYKNILVTLQTCRRRLSQGDNYAKSAADVESTKARKAEAKIKAATDKAAQTWTQEIEKEEKKIQAIQAIKSTSSAPVRYTTSPDLEEFKAHDVLIRPPPPPEILRPKDLLSTRSANIAYQKNLLRDEWNNLYVKYLDSSSRVYQAENNKQFAKLTAKNENVLIKLTATITKWHELHQEYIIVKRIEFLQEAIDKDASSKEVRQKAILTALRPIDKSHRESIKSMILLKQKHGELVDEIVGQVKSPFLQNLVSTINRHSASKKQGTAKTSQSLRKRDSNLDSTRVDDLLEKSWKDVDLGETKEVIFKNLNQILKISSLNSGIFQIIRHAQFVSQINSQMIVEDLKILIQLLLISEILDNQHTYLHVNLKESCDPKIFKSVINDEEATFCTPDNSIIKILNEKDDKKGKDFEPISFKELDQFSNSNGYQLSQVVMMSLECTNPKDMKRNHLWDQPKKPNSLSRLAGISACAVEIPVTYSIN